MLWRSIFAITSWLLCRNAWKKLKENGIKVWLINTGWSGGSYGKGKRIDLTYTHAMLVAVLSGGLNNVSYQNDPVFGVIIPLACAGVPTEILNPRNTWLDKEAYDKQAAILTQQFVNNFKKYQDKVSVEILSAAPISISLN